MKKIILCRGLPASGKSTWAKEMVDKHPGQYKRVNKDELRAMIDNGKWSRDNEKFVLEVRDAVIVKALEKGKHVIVDDTNLHQKHEAHMQEIIKIFKPVEVQLEIKDFTDIPLDICITRDAQRPNAVGSKVIRTMYNQYLRPKPPIVERDTSLPNAYIFDMDGTLALFGDANPYDRDFLKDELNRPVADILIASHSEGNRIIIVSGRKDLFREQTEKWLDIHDIPYQQLFMRKAGDDRKDTIIKEEIYNEHIKGKYNIMAVIDDRLQVCRLWYRLGLPLFKVGDPDADF